MKFRLFIPLITFSAFFCSFIIAAPKANLPKEVPFKLEEIKKDVANTINTEKKEKNIVSGPRTFSISGETTASNSTLSFPVSGFIKQILHKAGSVVKKGEILAKLDATDYEVQLKIAKAKKTQALVLEKTAKSELNREKILKSEDASTQAQFEKVESSYNQAKAGLDLAELQVKEAEIKLEHTNLRAPYDSVIAKQYQERAEHVGVGAKVFDVSEINTIEVVLNVPEILVGKIQIGSKLSISVPSTRYTGKAIVTSVVPIVSKLTRTFEVRAKFENNDKRIVPGVFAEAQITLEP